MQPAIKKLKEQPIVTNLLKLNDSNEGSQKEEQESDPGMETKAFETEEQERAKIFETSEESGIGTSQTADDSATPSPPPPGLSLHSQIYADSEFQYEVNFAASYTAYSTNILACNTDLHLGAYDVTWQKEEWWHVALILQMPKSLIECAYAQA